jgi:Na+/H+-dicarboxylate symporter
LGLVAPGIAELGKGAGKLLCITALIAYASTLISGFFSYFTCRWSYPMVLVKDESFSNVEALAAKTIQPFMSIDMPPLMTVTTALILAFVLGLGLTAVKGDYFKNSLIEFRDLVTSLISKAIIPFLPLYIFCIFLKIGAEGQVGAVLQVFIKVIVIIFIMHILLLLFQFCVAGAIAKKNPIKALITMLPAYMTALGTQSSAATIPVTLAQAKKNGVNEDIAGFTVPLCATVHLAGSILKIVACAYAIMWMMGMEAGIDVYAGFICMLGITMVAAPGVPGGAIMAALGLLASMLGFDETLQGLMIALYITMDSFGTACNVTGDGAIALIIDKIYKK